MAAAPRPVVNREHARSGRWGHRILGHAHGHAQQRVGTGGHGQALGKPCSGLAAECEAEMALQAAQPLCPACRARRDVGHAFGKGLAWAGRCQAAEPAHPDAQRHAPSLPGQVIERATIQAVNTLGRHAALGT